MKSIGTEARVVWWDAETRDLWKPRLDRIRNAYHKTEFLYTKLGYRKVYVYHVRSQDFEKSYDLLRENNMIFYPMRRTAVYQGFSHHHPKPKEGEPFFVYGVVSKKKNKYYAEKFIEYSKETEPNHYEIGKLLGYPECCLKFFDETWDKVSIDPIYEAALNTQNCVVTDNNAVEVECSPYTNNMLRYFGIRIIPHLTHSFDCKRSIRMGKIWHQIMRSVDEEAADWAYELLSSECTWDCYKGVAIIDTPYFRGVTNSDPVLNKKIVKNKGYKRK